jgi:hypothetical protein
VRPLATVKYKVTSAACTPVSAVTVKNLCTNEIKDIPTLLTGTDGSTQVAIAAETKAMQSPCQSMKMPAARVLWISMEHLRKPMDLPKEFKVPTASRQQWVL